MSLGLYCLFLKAKVKRFLEVAPRGNCLPGKEAWLTTQLMRREPCGEEAVMSLTLKLGGVALPDVWCPHWIEFRTVMNLL